MKPKKKIAVITPFLAQGGLEKVAVMGAKALEEHYDVTMIVFDASRVDYPYDGKMIDLKVPFYGRNIFKRVFNLACITFKLRKIKKSEKFDLIIVHGELANLAVVFTGIGNHIVVIHENSFAAIKDVQGKFFSLFSKRVYHAKNTKKIVTVSRGIAGKFMQNYSLDANRVMTIYNPCDTFRIQEDASEPLGEYAELFDGNVIIAVGRLTEAKGHRYLLQIFQHYTEKSPDIKLILLGDGELRDELTGYAKSLGLKVFSVFDDDIYSANNDVYFMGFHSNPYKYIAKAKLFVMTSLWEGFGNTLIESMACGTPVISSDCPSGPREIIAPAEKQSISEVAFARYGVMVPALRTKGNQLSRVAIGIWCNTLRKIIDDDAIMQEYKIAGLLRAKEFDTKIIAEKWHRLVVETLQEQSKREERGKCYYTG